ncbi:hypothetical protein ABT299_23395 [Spirillospora sp. NPDC000708]
MAYELKDLTEVMEAESAGGAPSPDLLDGVRRRVRRGDRRRAAAGALGVLLVAGAVFGVVQRQDGPGAHERQVLAPAMEGVTNGAFPKSRSVEGLKPVKEVRFSEFGRMARVTFTPTGPFTMYTARCERDATWYDVTRAETASSACGGEIYLSTKPGVPVTVETTALPVPVVKELGDAPTPGSLARFLAAHDPVPGAWSLRAYSGPCASDTCRMMKDPSSASPPAQPPLTGLKELGRAAGIADGISRTVPLTERGKTLRLRVTCLDGAATAVLRIAGRVKAVDCEIGESQGVVWDQDAGTGTDGIGIAVLPAAAGAASGIGDATPAAAMKGVEPAGRWTLEVYAR